MGVSDSSLDNGQNFQQFAENYPKFKDFGPYANGATTPKVASNFYSPLPVFDPVTQPKIPMDNPKTSFKNRSPGDASETGLKFFPNSDQNLASLYDADQRQRLEAFYGYRNENEYEELPSRLGENVSDIDWNAPVGNVLDDMGFGATPGSSPTGNTTQQSQGSVGGAMGSPVGGGAGSR